MVCGMKFNLCFANLSHPDRDFGTEAGIKMAIEDMVRYLQLALERIGHAVTLNANYVDHSAVNLFIERFCDPAKAAELQQEGYRFGLICTEPLTEPGLYNSFDYGPDVASDLRRGFDTVARRADFVWHVLPEAGPACRALNERSFLLPFGFVDGYAQMKAPAQRRPQVDYLVSGSPVARRGAIVAELRQRGVTVAAPSAFQPGYIRLAMTEQARATLAIKKTPDYPVFSVARAYHAIMNQAPLLMEYDGPETSLSPFVDVAGSAGFVEACVAHIRQPDLPRQAADRLERFRAELDGPMAMALLVEHTFATAAQS